MDDHTRWRYEMRQGFGMRSVLSVLHPAEPGSLPKPLEDAAQGMYDAKSDDEAKMAAREFLTLSEEYAVNQEDA